MVKPYVDVILATYNGEKFLEEQIQSLLAQTYSEIKIIISDDGSSDDTLVILKKYESQFEHICIVNEARQGGVVNNFNKALAYSKSNYIMFCDQDDIWLENKVKDSLGEILKLEGIYGNDIPLCSFSDLTVVDASLNVIDESFYHLNNLSPSHNLDKRFLCWRSTVYGCSMIFNSNLKSACYPMPNNIPMHDQWVAIFAVKHGHISYMNKSNILYRQHENNVVGGAGKGFLGKLFSLFKNLKSIKRAANQIKVLNYKLGIIRSDRLSARLLFVKNNVFPFINERPIYTLFFIYFFIVKPLNRQMMINIGDQNKDNNV